MGRPMQNQSAWVAQSQLILWNFVILRRKKNIFRGGNFFDNNIWLRYEKKSEWAYFKECVA